MRFINKLPNATYGDLLEYLANDGLSRLEKEKSGRPQKPKVKTKINPVTSLEGPSELLHPDKVKREKNSDTSNTEATETTATLATPQLPVRPTPRVYISKAIRQEAWRRSGGRCERVTQKGVRCANRKMLELDHRIPLAHGGSNDSINLRLVCRQCNQYEAQRILSTELMKKFIPSLM